MTATPDSDGALRARYDVPECGVLAGDYVIPGPDGHLDLVRRVRPEHARLLRALSDPVGPPPPKPPLRLVR